MALYVWLHAMACAFGAPNGGCRVNWPWQLRGDDLLLLVILPGIVTMALFLGARAAGRRD